MSPPAGAARALGPDADEGAVGVLVRAAREFRRGGWVFTGFHWPVLAGQLAHALPGEPFRQVFEAGAATRAAAAALPTSTTDFAALADVTEWCDGTAATLLALPRRYDRVVLDASNIDVAGRVNSSMLGPAARPRVRLPGGGGAPDVAARARELVWISGATGVDRVQHRVEHVTAAPGPDTRVVLHTRWGRVRLGATPVLEEVADLSGTDAFVSRLEAVGVETRSAEPVEPVSADEREAALRVLVAAAARGYRVARAALGEEVRG